jgi:hypothetical protein
LVADLRGLLARDVPLALGFALLSVIIRPFLLLVLGCAQTHRWDARIWLPEHSRWTYPLLVRATCRKFLLTAYRWQLKLATSAGLLRLEAGRRFAEVRNDPAARELAYATLNAS